MRSPLWHRVCLYFAFVEEPCPAPYGAPVHSLAALAPGDPQRTNDHLEPPKGAAAGITGRVRADRAAVNGRCHPEGGGRGNNRQGCRWCRVARADRDSQVSALGVGLPSGGPFPVRAPVSAPETCTWSTRSEGGRQLARPQPRRKPDRAEVPNMCWTCGSPVS